MAFAFYHRTADQNAAAILAEGFRDNTDTYMTDREWTGVWFSDRPLTGADGAPGDTVLEVLVELPSSALDEFEWKNEGPIDYREWLVPAQLINAHAAVRILSELELDALL